MIMQDKYINPLTDFGFKKLFGTEPNKDLLIDFLNQLLPSNKKVKNLSYTKNEHLGNSPIDRKAIFDLYCESKNGEKFIVEMQKAKQNYFKDRSVYYATFPIQEQAKRGEWNYKLNDIFTIGILDFVFDDTPDNNYLTTVKLKDQDCQVFYDKLTFIYLELPKFTKTEQQLQSKFDKWMFVLKHLANLQNRPTALKEKVFKKLFEAAEIAKFSPKEKQQYEDSLKYYRDIKNVVDTSKEEGREEGREEGKLEGLKQGKDEKSMEVVKQGLKEGLSVTMLSKLTGLSEDTIREIQKDFKF